MKTCVYVNGLAQSSFLIVRRYGEGGNSHALIFAEHAVDIFETASGGLRIEEVDDRDEGGVEDRPDDVESPAQILNANGCNLDHY